MNFSSTGNYFKKKLRVNAWFYQVLPFLLWMVFVLLPFLMPASKELSRINKGFMLDMFYRNLVILFIFYIHSYLIFPIRKKWILYIFLVILLLFSYLGISHYLRPKAPPFSQEHERFERRFREEKLPAFDRPQRPFSIFFHLPPFVVAVLCSYCYCLLLGFNKRERILSERENTQLKTELSFLRSQISPHFMFNVLNSMVSLARKNSALLEPSLINMSNLMRYMLYERNGNVIFLKTEIEYLRNYIDLQLLRYGDTVKLNMYVSGSFDFYQIEPMLLLPFVENAFKHGISMVDEPLIDIFLTIDNKTDTLQFVVLNNISPVKDMQEGESGIGLQNIRRRLELLYRGKYKLNLSDGEALFKAEIIIKLT